MSDRSDRLKRAFRERGLTQAQAVERWGWNKNTLKSNLNGNVDFSFAKAKDYGAKLKVRPEWLYGGEGTMEPTSQKPSNDHQMVPVISWVSAGRLAAQEDVELIEPDEGVFAAISGLPKSRYFATVVNGDSMDRISPDGSVLIVDVNDTEPRAGRSYIFSVRGEATFKMFQDDPVVRLEPYSTNPENRPIFPKGDQQWIVVGRVVRSIFDLR